MDDRFKNLYDAELRHLRESGREFGRAYPTQAGALALEANPPDPYVERLLEGTAFLAARVRLKLEAQFPQFTEGLLETVFPDFLAPLPSMAIFQLQPEVGSLPPPGGVIVPREARIEGLPASTVQNDARGRAPTPCWFSLVHDVRLLPIEVTQVDCLVRRLHEAGLPPQWQAKSAVRLRLRKLDAGPWKDIRLDPLVCYLPGKTVGYDLIELLLGQQLGLVVRDVIPSVSATAGTSCEPWAQEGQLLRKYGFGPAEAALPVHPRVFEGHRLLREYFLLPERFLFVQFTGFAAALEHCVGEEIELLVGCSSGPPHLESKVAWERSKNPGAGCPIELFCAPAINLFHNPSGYANRPFTQEIEPDRFSEFHVVPDTNRPADFEVYSVESVEAFGESKPEGQHFAPFFRARHLHRAGRAFFTSTRQHRAANQSASKAGADQPRAATERSNEPRADYLGSDTYLSLVDAAQAPFAGDINQLSISARLTNRHLPLALREGAGRWSLLGGAKARVQVMVDPTQTSFRQVDGPLAWRLINLFSLNYLSLVESDAGGSSALRELLGLCADETSPSFVMTEPHIAALRGVRVRPLTRPLRETSTPEGPARIVAVVRGLEIVLEFDGSALKDQGVILLGAVLEEFFARYAAINSFTETVIKSVPDGLVRMRWPLRPGLKPRA